jgi:mono/diheme cytochrome c family protein
MIGLTPKRMAMAIAATALLALALAACGPGGATSASSNQVARGRTIYQANCATCHGANGEGQPDWKRQNQDETYPAPPHDASGHTWHHGDGLLFRTVRDGGKIYETPGFKSAMPPFGDRLSPDEIRAVLAYLKTLWPQELREVQAEASKNDPFPQP